MDKIKRIPQLTFINNERQIQTYLDYHGVKFDLVEFYDLSLVELSELLIKGKITQEEFEAQGKQNLKHLVEFNFTHKDKSKRRRKVVQEHPYVDMTLGLPEY